VSVNLDRFAEAVKEALHEQAEAMRREEAKRRPWTVRFTTRDGCRRDTQMQWDDGPPDEIKVPFWSEDGRRQAGERLYGRGAYSEEVRAVHYYEKEPAKPKVDKLRWRPFDMEIRNFWHFQWDEVPPRPWPTKEDELPKPESRIVQTPTPEEVKKYTLSGGGRTENIIEVPKKNVWGRIEIPVESLRKRYAPPPRLVGIHPSRVLQDVV
jgi:hypothetical protein